jgi:hypothetical protein
MTAPLLRSRRFLRLETDAEFRERLRTCKRVVWTMTHAVHQHGEGLDAWSWEHYKTQRKLIEDES